MVWTNLKTLSFFKTSRWAILHAASALFPISSFCLTHLGTSCQLTCTTTQISKPHWHKHVVHGYIILLFFQITTRKEFLHAVGLCPCQSIFDTMDHCESKSFRYIIVNNAITFNSITKSLELVSTNFECIIFFHFVFICEQKCFFQESMLSFKCNISKKQIYPSWSGDTFLLEK